MAVVGLASEATRLAASCRIPVDDRYGERPTKAGTERSGNEQIESNERDTQIIIIG